MKYYKVTSPSGKVFSIYAESIYHAVSKVVNMEGWKYSNIEYLNLSK